MGDTARRERWARLRRALWLLAARGDEPQFRRPSWLFVAGTVTTAVLLAGPALLPAASRVPAWAVIDAAYLAGFTALMHWPAPAPRRPWRAWPPRPCGPRR